MEKQFLKIIKEQLSPNSKLLLACSGGSDSVALFHLMLSAKLNFQVAHVNYQLRGAESTKDEAFVRDLCQVHQIPFYLKVVSVEKKEGSIQEIARNMRYAFFDALRQELKYDYLLTAHHQGDDAENLLFRFCRGTGLMGLLGLNVLQNGVFRPLLGFSKGDILKYLHTNNHAFREDASNLSDKYTRNKIRNKVLPLLEEDLPNIEKRITQSAQLLSRDFDLLKYFMLTDKQLVYDGLFKVNCKEIRLHFSSFWYYLLEDVNCTADEAEIIAAACKKAKNGFSIAVGQCNIAIIKNQVIIQRKVEHFTSERVSIKSKKQVVRLNERTISIDFYSSNKPVFDNNTMCFDKDAIAFPVAFKHPQPGDKFVPLGMIGSKLLSDFYNDLGIAAHQKKNEWVLYDVNGKVVCAFPHRIANEFRVTESTKEMMVVKEI